MALLNDLVRTFNVMGPKISITTTRPTYRQSEEISGNVRISAPDYPIRGRAILIELMEYWRELSRDPNKNYETVCRTVDSAVLEGRFSFAPRSVHTFFFQFRLPRNCRLPIGENDMRLVVTLDIPKPHNPQKKQGMNILPARELKAIVQTVGEHMGFREYRPLRGYKAPFTHFHFLPPASVYGRIRHLGLDMQVGRDFGVMGNLLIRPREKSWDAYFRGILGFTVSSTPFALSPSQLFLPDGSPNTKAIVETLGTLIW